MTPSGPRALTALCVLIGALAIAVACGGSSSKTATPDFPKVVALGKGEGFPLVADYVAKRA